MFEDHIALTDFNGKTYKVGYDRMEVTETVVVNNFFRVPSTPCATTLTKLSCSWR